MDTKNIKLVVFEDESLSAVSGFGEFIQALKSEGVQTALLAGSSEFDFDFCLDKTGGESLKELIATTGTHWFNVLFFVSSQNLLDQTRKEDLKSIVYGSVLEFPSADNLFTDFAELDPRMVIEVGRPKRPEADPWVLTESEFIPAKSPYWESLFAACNGYMGLRGCHPETTGTSEEFASPGFFINGYYAIEFPEGYRDRYGPCKSQIMLNLIDWRRIDLLVDDEPVVITPQTVKSYSRSLDMRTGLVTRELICLHGGKEIKIEEQKLVSMVRHHSAAISYRVTPLNFNGKVTLRSGLKTDTFTVQFGMTGLKTVDFTAEDGDFCFTGKTQENELMMFSAIQHSCRCADDSAVDATNTNLVGTLCETDYSRELAAGETLTLEKHAAFYTEIDPEDCELDIARATVASARSDGFQTLEKEQTAFWMEFWAANAIEIEGCISDLQAVHFNQFVMRQNLPPADNCSISATGVTGAKYRGWIFWDTEIFMAPQFNFSDPEKMKRLLDFRYNQLEQARANAEFFYGRGAAFPWSTVNGNETNHDLMVGRGQYHISLDIACAAWQYVQVSGDEQWLIEKGLEMMLEISRFFLDLGAFSPALDGQFVINVVCGPDEYSFHVNNNYYTNLLCKALFENTLKTLEIARAQQPGFTQELLERLKIADEELSQFELAAEKMFLPYSEKFEVHEQDDCYLTRNPFDMTKVPRNFEIKHDMGLLEISRRQVTKQADLVLAMYLMPDHFSAEAKKKNYDFYEPRTCHASSLSPCGHGIMASEIGHMEEAYNYFRQTAYMDLDDLKGNTKEGIHFACSGGTWLITVAGFAGMRLGENGLRFYPRLPDAWNRLSFPIYFRGNRLFLDITKDSCKVTLTEGAGCTLQVAGKAITLSADHPESVIDL